MLDGCFWNKFIYNSINIFNTTIKILWLYIRNTTLCTHIYKITSIGLPFLIMSTGMSKLILADGRPKASMFCMLIGAVINTILNPLFILFLIWELLGLL